MRMIKAPKGFTKKVMDKLKGVKIKRVCSFNGICTKTDCKDCKYSSKR